MSDNSYNQKKREIYITGPVIADMVSLTLSVSRAQNIMADAKLSRRNEAASAAATKADKIIRNAIETFEKEIGKAHTILQGNTGKKAKRQKGKTPGKKPSVEKPALKAVNGAKSKESGTAPSKSAAG